MARCPYGMSGGKWADSANGRRWLQHDGSTRARISSWSSEQRTRILDTSADIGHRVNAHRRKSLISRFDLMVARGGIEPPTLRIFSPRIFEPSRYRNPVRNRTSNRAFQNRRRKRGRRRQLGDQADGGCTVPSVCGITSFRATARCAQLNPF